MDRGADAGASKLHAKASGGADPGGKGLHRERSAGELSGFRLPLKQTTL